MRLAVLLLSLLFAGHARADEPRAHSLGYSSSGCPDEALFRSRVAARTRSFRLLGGDPRSPVQVVIERDGGVVHAELTVALADGSTLHRTLEAASCPEAVEALAFVTAIALDPGSVEVLAEEPPPVVAPIGPPAAPHAISIPRGLQGSLGAMGRVMFAALPTAALGGGAFGAVSYETGRVLSPLLRFDVAWLGTAVITTPLGGAAFEQVIGTLDLCPVAFGTPSVRLRPCIYGTAGAQWSRGEGAATTAEAVRPYGEVGGSGLFELGVGAHLALELRGTVGAPLVRDQYVFDETVVVEVGPVCGSVSLGAAYRFR